MDPKFAAFTEELHGTFERLMGMVPITDGFLPTNLPQRGVYLFSEGGKHLYVGRSNSIRNRYFGHSRPGATQNSAAFAMILSREETGRKASYRAGPDSRSGLMLDPTFSEVFSRQKARIRAMEFRCVEEKRPVQQTLLEVYCAVVLGARYNGEYPNFCV